jgi:acyl-coenzyme A thioesterase PaaI-like protein
MDFLVRIPFIEHLGFELLRVEPGLGEIAIEVRERLRLAFRASGPEAVAGARFLLEALVI